MARQFTLGKKERLKSRKQIELLFKNGQRFVVPSFRVFYSFRAHTGDVAGEPLQAGFSASSRNFKTAVSRNRIKRLTREAYRVQKNVLKDQLEKQNRSLNVFFIYTGRELPTYDEVYSSINLALSRLIDINKKRV